MSSSCGKDATSDVKREMNFKEHPNMHPVYYTGMVPAPNRKLYYDRLVYGKTRSKQVAAEWSGLERENSNNGDDDEVPPAIGPPVSMLPPNWSVTSPVSERDCVSVYETVHIVVPFHALDSESSMNFALSSGVEIAFYNAWMFVNQALCSKHEGTRSDLSNNHLFPLMDDNGGKPRNISKLRVYGEMMVQDWDGIMEEYLRERFAGRTVTEADRTMATTEVAFRRRVHSKKNMSGFRFFIFVLDRRLNFGRALQHRLWKNELLMGVKSGIEITTRYETICKVWKAKIETMKSVDEPSVVRDPMEEFDIGPEVDLTGDKLTPEEEVRDSERDKMLGDGDEGEEEPEGDDIGGGGGGEDESSGSKRKQSKKAPSKASKKKKSATPGGPDQGPQQPGSEPEPTQAETERQREERRRSDCLRRLAALGIKLPAQAENSKESYRRKINHLFQKFVVNAANGASGGNRGTVKSVFIPQTKREQLNELCRKLSTKKRYITQTTNLREMIQLVYGGLLNIKEFSREELDKLEDDAVDLGDYSNPFNPSKFFTFERTLNNWFNDASGRNEMHRPCAAQCDEANYYSSRTGEFKFPIPSLVWQFPEPAGFKASNIELHKPFWWFSPFSEQLAQTEAKARERRVQQLRQQKQQQQTRPLTAFETLEKERQAKWLASDAYKEKMKTDQKYASKKRVMSTELAHLDRFAAKLADAGIQTSANTIREAQQSFIVDDIMAELMAKSKDQMTRVRNAYEVVPEDRELLLKLYRESQFDAYKAVMKPGAAGTNEIHKIHTTYLANDDERKNRVHFPYTGYQNLTYYASLVGEFLLGARIHMGLNNSHHILYLMSWSINANCYRGSRRIPLHIMKVGPPGLGKTYLDQYFMRCKVPGTVVETLHTSNLAKFVEVVQNDRLLMEDEASSATIGDSSKASSAKDHQSITIHKAWLSSDHISFMVWAKHEDGTTYQRRKVVAARGCHMVNANIHRVNKDRSVYDRYCIFTIVPWFSPIAGPVTMINADVSSEMLSWDNLYIQDLTKLDTVVFRLCKMIDLQAAAEPNISDLVLHMSRGLPKIGNRYKVVVDNSKRTMQKALEIGATTVITAAALKVFSGAWSPTISEGVDENGFTAIDYKPWTEDFMKSLRYHLFMTEDIKYMVLSQIYRQILGDYAPWHSMHFIGRALLGFTDAYFDKLFDEHAWKDHPFKTDENGKPMRKQKFPFTHASRLYKNPTRRGQPVPSYVLEEELLFNRFDSMGIVRRKCEAGEDKKTGQLFATNQNKLPCFLYYHVSVGKTPEELRAEQSRAAPPPGTIYNGSPTHSDKSQTRPPRMVIDPNWLAFPGTLTQASEQEARELGQDAFKDPATTEYSLRHLMANKRITVPRLKLMSGFDEAPEFETRLDRDPNTGQTVTMIALENIPVIKYEMVPYFTLDPLSENPPERPGKRLLISTMALKCFRPAMGLFELLTAMEYEFTPQLTTIIDLPVQGYEGTNHTHTSYQNPEKKLRKQVSATLTTSVIRSLFLEHTSAVWTRFPQECKDLKPDELLDNKKIAEFVEKTMREFDKQAMHDGAQDFRDTHGGADKFQQEIRGIFAKTPRAVAAKQSVEDKVAEERERRKKQIENESLQRLPASAPFNGLMKEIAHKFENPNEYYERYHIYEEFEEWMRSEYGKAMIKKTAAGRVIKDRTKAFYYPGRDIVRINEYVEYSAAYMATRRQFNGARVEYPAEIISDFQIQESESQKKDASKTISSFYRSQESCKRIINNYRRVLPAKWSNNNNSASGASKKGTATEGDNSADGGDGGQNKAGARDPALTMGGPSTPVTNPSSHRRKERDAGSLFEDDEDDDYHYGDESGRTSQKPRHETDSVLDTASGEKEKNHHHHHRSGEERSHKRKKEDRKAHKKNKKSIRSYMAATDLPRGIAHINP